MKLLDTIILSLAAVAFIIGVHQTFYFGISGSYWIYMISLFLLLWFNFRKPKNGAETDQKIVKKPIPKKHPYKK